jgi:type VI secretion system protein ImpK
MAEESKNIDPEATVVQPAAAVDPDATVSLPTTAMDPEATVSGPIAQPEPDSEITITGAAVAQTSTPAAADRRSAFDPDATVNPAERVNLDPDATVRISSPGKARKNPFAPKSPPETIQANLSALGGLNPLIAMANPILGAVPQIRRALKHSDPAGLRASLRDQIESLQTSAMSADIPDAIAGTAVYALCALLDESAAATPWGGAWIDNGLLKEICSESGGGEGFFTRLETIRASQSPENTDNADLLEFYDVCLTLGFEGRHRNAVGGRQSLDQIRSGLYEIISRRRPRPDGLSERWRSATAEAAAEPALQMAAQVSAQISALQAAGANAEDTLPPVKPSFLSRVPRRAVWSALVGVIGAMIVFYLLALRLLEDETKSTYVSRPKAKAKVEQTARPAAPLAAPVPLPASAALAKALDGEPVTVTQDGAGIALVLRHERQFAPGSTRPAPELRPLLQKIAAALDQAPGSIVVSGHADASPTQRYASNLELSASRAQEVVRIMAPKLGDLKRLTGEGKGESEPLAPNDTDTNRAKNRRVVIVLKPAP